MRKMNVRRVRFGLVILLPAFLLGGSPAALALGPTGDLEILVSDGAGAPLPAASLKLTGTSLLGERTAETTGDGRFVFRALLPGVFEVDISYQGRQGIHRGGIVIDAGRTASVSVALEERRLEEYVTVFGREPLVDVVRTTNQVTYDREYLEHVPVGLDARYSSSVLAAAPGVVGTQVRGTNVADNVYLVDGADTNDPYFSREGTVVIPSAIEQLQVQTGAFSAEYGRATGGVSNVVTKSGGNEFSGTVDLRYGSAGMLSAGDHFDPDAIDYSRKVGEFGLGGPVVRDKLWFFVAGDYDGSEDGPPGSPTTAKRDRTSWLGKLTWQAAEAHTFTFLGMYAPQTVDDADSSPLVAAEATQKRDGANQLVSLRYLGVLGPHLLVDAQVASYRSSLQKEPQSGDVSTRCAIDLLTGVTSRNSCRLEDDWKSRDVLTGGVTWQVGRHALRAGVDLQSIETGGHLWKPGGGIDQVAPDPNGSTVTVLAIDYRSPWGLDLGGDLHAGYIQDEWRIHPRVTANLGVRYSDYEYTNDAGEKVFWTELIEPRVGIAWDLTGEAKHVVKGTWSRFGFSSTLEIVHSANQNLALVDYYANENVGGYLTGSGAVPEDLNGDNVIEARAYLGSEGGPTGVVYANGGHLDAPRTDEWTLSYDRQIGPSIAAGATYVRRRTSDLIEDRFDPKLNAAFVDNLDGLRREYEGVETRLRGQWRFGMTQASYVWSKTRGNSDYTIWPGVSPEYDYPATSTNRWGYMSTDTRHAVKVNGFVRLPLAFEVGYGYNYASGYAWTLERSAFPYGREYPEGRGTRRLPHFSQLDLALSRGFGVGKTDMRLILAVLNVLNDQAVTAVNPLVGVAGTPIDYQRPRRWEVGIHYSF